MQHSIRILCKPGAKVGKTHHVLRGIQVLHNMPYAYVALCGGCWAGGATCMRTHVAYSNRQVYHSWGSDIPAVPSALQCGSRRLASLRSSLPQLRQLLPSRLGASPDARAGNYSFASLTLRIRYGTASRCLRSCEKYYLTILLLLLLLA